MNDRTTVSDLLAVANVGYNCRRIVRYSATTLNTPYKDGLTAGIDSGLAIISMGGSNNYGTILCMPEGGNFTAPYIRKRTNGVWGDWIRLATHDDLSKVFGTGTAIPIGADLDDYTTPGAYYSIDTNTTATLKNVPSWLTTGFRMEVINTTITGWFIQKIYSNQAIQNTTIRLHAGTKYLDWCRSITNADINGLTASQQPSLNRANMVVKTPAGTKFQFLFGDNGTVKLEKDSGSGWEGAKQLFP